MPFPMLTINREKLIHNTRHILFLCRAHGVEPHIVTKVFCAYPPLLEMLREAGVSQFADSRLKNLERLSGYGISNMMLRLPMPSEADEVVRLSHISLNSEPETLRALSDAAVRQQTVHGVILMVELGDLREGESPDRAADLAKLALRLPGLRLLGVGANLNCYGGVIPDEENLGRLLETAQRVETACGTRLAMISGGNSGSLYLMLEGRLPQGINHLRIGEAVVLGRETSFGQKLPGMYDDVFALKAEVVESKVKPSMPVGQIGMDAFGARGVYHDKGDMRRVIVACGRQDTICCDLIPRDPSIGFVGASSDHMILDATALSPPPRIGDVLEFLLPYGALLAACTSEYIHKQII